MAKLTPLPVLLVFSQAFHLLHSLIQAQPSYIYKICTNTSNYKEGSQFQENLNSLLSQPIHNDIVKSSTGIFYNTTRGNFPDEVYGIFLCRADVPAITCQNCIDAARVAIVNECPFTIEAIIWYDECLIRYSNGYLFSRKDEVPLVSTSNVTDTKRFDEIHDKFNIMFNGIIFNASYDSSYRMYAKAQVNITGSIRLYGAERWKTTIITIGASVSAFLVVAFLGFCIWYRRRRKRTEEEKQANLQKVQLPDLAGERLTDDYSGETFSEENQANSQDFPLLRFDLIREATQQFSVENKLGEGGFGPVYMGTLADGKKIAVKRLSRSSGQGLKEFKAEVTLIARLQHRNLVKLLGCCLEGKELLLVYDYMPNKSLDVFLVDPTKGAQLDWTIRHRIINGIARGMLYLHEDSRLRIIHRDLKSSNVLLDHEMNPKISDFGMARIVGSNQIEANTNRVVGTYGYMAPEYAMKGIFSVKSDVFSFGVLLLEIISGKKNSRFHLSGHGHNLLTFAWKLWSDDHGLELLDLLLKESYVETEVLKCIHIGLLCVQEDPANRPTMSSVVFMLGSDAMTLPQPTEPAFFLGRVFPSAQPEPKDIGSSVNEVHKLKPEDDLVKITCLTSLCTYFLNGLLSG